jgi:hypothetical protein
MLIDEDKFQPTNAQVVLLIWSVLFNNSFFQNYNLPPRNPMNDLSSEILAEVFSFLDVPSFVKACK